MRSELDVNAGPIRILVIFAVPEEAGPFRRLRLPGIRVLVTGMGQGAARQAVEAEFARGAEYDLVLTCGFCGALAPELRRGTVLLSDDSDAEMLSIGKTEGIGAGRFHCAEAVATTGEMKAMLRKETSADVVEMESGVVAEICRRRGTRVATVRVVSDEADEDLPLDFNKLITRRGGIHFGRLAFEVARRPRMISELMRLQKRTREAAGELAKTLERLLVRLRIGNQSP